MVTRDSRPLKIALACPGVGLVQRGFERYFMDLYELLKNEADVILFKGGGNVSETERVPFFISRNGRLVHGLPIHTLFGRTPMHTECLTFAFGILPALIREKVDIIHCIDPPLAKVMFKLRNAMGLRFKILYTEGCAMPPGDYPPADHIHQTAKMSYDEAAAFGHPVERMTLVPCGFSPERFARSQTRDELRREYGVRPETFVVLSVSALNRYHKRTHHLIDECSRVRGDMLLWLDGSLDHGDPDLIDVAKQKLGDRCRITHVPSASVGDLYRLADVMVHCAIFEAFGLAIVEGASTDLPMLVHNGAHFRWLLQNPRSCLDMEKSGELEHALSGMIADRGQLGPLVCGESVRNRFAWTALKQAYLDLYARVSVSADIVTVGLRA